VATLGDWEQESAILAVGSPAHDAMIAERERLAREAAARRAWRIAVLRPAASPCGCIGAGAGAVARVTLAEGAQEQWFGQRTRLVVGDYWGTGRVEAFSDGVFAIAITLLVLEISVPESAFDDLWRGIAEQWPSYLAYATSFITIGGIWFIHHAIFRRLQYANRRVMLINLMLLMAVAFLPFPTKLMAEAIHEADAARAAVIFYGAALFVTSLLLSLVWGSVVYDRKLLMPEVDEQEVNAIALAAAPTMGFYAVIIALAIVAPRVAAFGYLLTAIVAVFRAYGDRTTPAPTA
jgi:uncharacterized membrane protein